MAYIHPNRCTKLATPCVIGLSSDPTLLLLFSGKYLTRFEGLGGPQSLLRFTLTISHTSFTTQLLVGDGVSAVVMNRRMFTSSAKGFSTSVSR